MNSRAILALVRNDLRLYRADPRAAIVGILVPILIAAFFGYVFGGAGKNDDQGKILIGAVDEDGSAVSRAIIADLTADKLLQVSTMTRGEARQQVKSGKQAAAAVFPAGFGEKTTRSLFTGRDKPNVELLVDPSQMTGARVIEGLLAQYSMQEISKEAFTGAGGRKAIDSYLAQLDQQPETSQRDDLRALLNDARKLNERQDMDDAAGSKNSGQTDGNARGFGLSIPYTLASTPVTSQDSVPYNGYAHSFAGMAVQFILLSGIDAGIVLLMTRQRGIWQRLRSSPVRRGEFIVARALATSLIGLIQITVIYLAAMLIFKVRVEGSWAGFVAVSIALCVLNATFGLMLATLGRSASSTRGLALMVTLLLVMLGGAWVPAFVFPRWLQELSLYVPTRWAIDGLDGATWRGLPFDAAIRPTLVLVATAAICLLTAIWRFRWEE